MIFLIVLLLIIQPLGWSKEDFTDTTMVFNISKDPYESNDLSRKESFAQQIKEFVNKKKYWQSLTIPLSEPDETGKAAKFKKLCGRVCPYSDQVDVYQPPNIEHKYAYSDAPHIVFILVDDWGYNDVGFRSSYLSWTTPNIDRLKSEGILLESYYTNEICAPSRASLLTGRYSLRLGLYDNNAELLLTETTLAQELKSAGYQNYMIGKWHLGYSTVNHLPLQRGFDYFYGFLNGDIDYYTKEIEIGYVDLFENNDFVTEPSELDHSLHTGYLFEKKAEEAVKFHAENYPDSPMFLYYAMQLIHSPYEAPNIYLERCSKEYGRGGDASKLSSDEVTIINYCAMNVMMDEAVGNLTCTLEKYGFSDNTVLIVSGDNGGVSSVYGNSNPFKGHKGSSLRGGISNTAIIHSKTLPSSSRGTSYSYDVHITDWLPTLMGLATGGMWEGSYNGVVLDGYDVWDSILQGRQSERTDMVFLSLIDSDSEMFSMQSKNIKYLYGINRHVSEEPAMTFKEDLNPALASMLCEEPSLVKASSHVFHPVSHLINKEDETIRHSLISQTFRNILFLGLFIALMSIAAFSIRKKFEKYTEIKSHEFDRLIHSEEQ